MIGTNFQVYPHVSIPWTDVIFNFVHFLFTSGEILFPRMFWKATTFIISKEDKFSDIKDLFFQMMATNIAVWEKFVAEEMWIFKGDRHHHKTYPWKNSNSSRVHVSEIDEAFKEYLVPFILKVSLVAACLLWGIYSGIEELKSAEEKTGKTIVSIQLTLGWMQSLSMVFCSAFWHQFVILTTEFTLQDIKHFIWRAPT